MKPLEAQNHYEALEITSDANAEEIERAYRMVRSSYAADSLALYSVFDEQDATAIRERIDLAYSVLSDERMRREYDEKLLGNEAPSAVPARVEEEAPAVDGRELPPIEPFEEIDDTDPDAEYDGARLRRARLHRGIEIDQVAAITKINPSYLKFLEEDSYGDLPAAVYVRGFVTAYARAIGLDGPRVAASYIAQMESAGQSRRPGRLLGRR